MPKPKSFFVLMSARALGSIGLGLSVLVIWLRWLVPAAVVAVSGGATPIPQPPTRYKRRTVLPAPSPSSTLPIMIHDGNINPDVNYRSKHVYFTDSTQSTQPRRSPPVQSPEPSIPRDMSTYEESIAESDTSSRRSSLSLHLPKLIQGKTRHTTGSPLPVTVTTTTTFGTDTHRSSKRSNTNSIGMTPPWASRNNRATDTETDAALKRRPLSFRRPSTPKSIASSLDPVPSPPSSYFSMKPQRRVSTPIPRTQPYEAPYFATPPSDLNTFDLRKPRQLFQEPLSNPLRKEAVAVPVDNHGDATRGRNLHIKSPASPGICRPRGLLRRRSASESWINGYRTTAPPQPRS